MQSGQKCTFSAGAGHSNTPTGKIRMEGTGPDTDLERRVLQYSGFRAFRADKVTMVSSIVNCYGIILSLVSENTKMKKS